MYEELTEKLRCCVEQIRCGDCRYVKDCDGDRMMMSEAADAIKELMRRCEQFQFMPLPAWVPVTKRLPKEENRTYWICTDTGYQCECRWTNNRFGIGESDEWGWSIADVPQYHKVVAWMFLPEPYEPPKEKEI